MRERERGRGHDRKSIGEREDQGEEGWKGEGRKGRTVGREEEGKERGEGRGREGGEQKNGRGSR